MVLLHHTERSPGKTGREPFEKQVPTQALSSAAVCSRVVSREKSHSKNNASAFQMKLPPMSFLSNLLCLQVKTTTLSALRTWLVPGSCSHLCPVSLTALLLHGGHPAPQMQGRKRLCRVPARS